MKGTYNMRDISNIYELLEISQLRGLLQCGETEKVSSESLEQRIKKANKRIYKILDKTIDDRKIYLKLESEINHYTSVCEDVYMEIGMKCGAILMMNLLKT